ncbi:C4-dicarboxylate transporter/malic acid transport protein [Microbacterium sp. AG790]|uniref:TDT family transporter n=1 Tax=Microbacterium sp. AG790 TaxID=2183995 RepID=UPI000EB1C247|nr:TDT family transporter [Microbacterium sp. AG790]RKS93020.1 C4-dicarboxylate transporter/malic acid transport protein [Microbacterium sp. AG790]
MTATAPVPRARRLFRDVPTGRALVSAVTPNWFASVMGTGIVATAAVTLPGSPAPLRALGLVAWLLAAVLLLVLLVATALHWLWHPQAARGHHLHPVVAHFYGAPAMAMLTVGAGALLVGIPLLTEPVAIAVDAVLWTAGTALGLATAAAIPYLQFTRHEATPDAAFGGWLMPVVPPMVSAATGALLIDHLPVGEARLTLLVVCGLMIGVAFLSTLAILPQIWGRLARHKVGPAAMVPTLWIVLGPLGQSVTAANQLATHAPAAVDGAWAGAITIAAVLLGLPVFGFALLWLTIAIALTVRTARAGLPFALTWWSFTFPVGTCVTAASGLALHTGSTLLAVIAYALFALLLTAWATVAIRTFHGAVITGRLLVPSPAA